MSKSVILIIGILVILLLSALAFTIFYKVGMSNAVFTFCFSRSDKEKWSRKCSNKNDRALSRMWSAGLDWAQENKEAKKELEVMSSGITLSAQYFDFGFEKAVIIIPGMFETSMYSYYYADVYKQAGFNCLLPDSRAHGLSEGSYFTAGDEEKKDIIEWAVFLHDRYGIKNIVLHGIAAGAAAAMLAVEENDCPSYIKGIVSDGCYAKFEDYFKNLLTVRKFGIKSYGSAMKKLFRYTGATAEDGSPVNAAKDIDIPALFIIGKSDAYVPEKESLSLFDEYGKDCGNKAKQKLVLENGTSEKLKFSDPEKYDAAICEFLDTLKL